MEGEPVRVGAVLTLGRAHRGVKAVRVEIEALGAGVVEHAVQDHPDAQFSRLGAQGPEVLLRPQHGVDPGVVRRVVAVVGGGLKDGAEVQRGDAQIRKIRELGGDARQGPAEKVPVADLAVRVRPPLRRVRPVLVDGAAAHHADGVREGQAAETVWENLVGNAFAKPVGRRGFPVDGQLPGLYPAVVAVAGGIQDAAGAVIPPEVEVIPDQIRQRGGVDRTGEADPVSLGAVTGELDVGLRGGELPPEDQGAVVEALGGQGTAVERHAPAAGDGAEGRFALAAAGVEDKRFTHGKNSSIQEWNRAPWP